MIRFLSQIDSPNRIIAGVRNVDKAKTVFKDYPKLEYVHFDFENSETFDNALSRIDRIFLLRSPHISDIETYFKPLISKVKNKNIK